MKSTDLTTSEQAAPTKWGRGEIISRIRRVRRFDVLIVGGGIHGAHAAHIAALNGLSTLLLERHDYAAETSSRTSKMAHGGLRYLELLDFKQVFEGIRARESLFLSAPHLCKPARFFFPSFNASYFNKLKMGFGLSLYDIFLRDKSRKHRWHTLNDLSDFSFGVDPARACGAFSYCDGLMRDTRIVIELIIAAREEGALCLNHAEVKSIGQGESLGTEVAWTDMLTGERYQVTAGAVLNCTGPMAPFLGRIKSSPLPVGVAYSSGVHLLFDRKWTCPPVFLPLAGKARYYWVWPHFAGTLVGTTERQVDEPVFDPQPTQNEINEILKRLEFDLPDAGLTRDKLHYAFSGIRILPARHKRRGVAEMSRRHMWIRAGNVFTLIGGKFTTARQTSAEGLMAVLRASGIKEQLVVASDRLLPGAHEVKESYNLLKSEAERCGTPLSLVERCVDRLGSRAAKILNWPDGCKAVGEVLAGEINLSLEEEQAETLEDLLRRRLELEFLPGNGMSSLQKVAEHVSRYRGHGFSEDQIEDYTKRIETLKQLMQGLEA